MEASTRSSRWNLRVAPTEDDVVREAARAEKRDLTDFVRSAAIKEAEQVLTDRARFELDPEQWKQFMELLDRPPQVPPGLRDLFSRPSAFD